MKSLWIAGALIVACGFGIGAQVPSVGIAISWMELDNFQSALPMLTLSQKVLLFSVRGETQIERGVALRLAAGWGFAFEGVPLGIAQYESALALNFPFGRGSAYGELGSGLIHLRQDPEDAWRWTGWIGAGGRFAIFPQLSVFFDIAPLALLDFGQPNLPWVWSYRSGALWRF